MQCRTLAIAVPLCVVVTPAYAEEQPVTPQEIQDTWVGRSLVGATPSGTPAVVRLQPDGSATVSAGSTNDTGSWRLSEQGYCTTWKNVRAGQERCFTAKRSGTVITVFNPDGSVSGKFTEIR